ncbi:exodeoxyribonuclease III [Pelagicoccus sp. SDUM812002]|uniref:exodeoxyribonuclease III n=1 Tax=Pelagicoccus sp. SDUM812002 TaxID=3041266 RepID=UPI00280D3506|nr:exodeoxyribonuclease III [Pelagicoccus sp. SDUM812002]MDQ8186087.1 exodeoxyribonuclease III [Pelagicoccus sp. SDUM812002]
MKFVSWNVNGIRAAVKKGAMDFFEANGADFICLQETKATVDIVKDFDWGKGATVLASEAVKKGYSGTAIIAREEPESVFYGLGIEKHDGEGRVVTAEYADFYLVTVYTPNAQNELRRLDYRMEWDRDFLTYVKNLESTKPVIFCGDLNVAHTENDLANPKTNRKNAGFSDEERAGFDNLLAGGFVDTFREFTQGKGHYSWWSYRAGARARNVGWRIDYFLISEALRPQLKKSRILPTILGSDHCPVEMTLG